MLTDTITRNNVDTVHHYHAWPGNDARCRLRLFWRKATAIAIVTELPDNPGMSVTNYAENLATEIAQRYGIEPGRLVLDQAEMADRQHGHRLFPPVPLRRRA